MIRLALAVVVALLPTAPLAAQDVNALAGKRVVFLGDSNTQAGGYIGYTTYYLEKLRAVTRANGPAVGMSSRSRSVRRRTTRSLAIAMPASAPVAS